MASSTTNNTGAFYGTGVFGTDRYGVASNNLTMFPDGVSGTGQIGSLNITTEAVGIAKIVNVNGTQGTTGLGSISLTTNVFDFNTVKDNYERRRTVYVHRRSNNADRTVKVA